MKGKPNDAYKSQNNGRDSEQTEFSQKKKCGCGGNAFGDYEAEHGKRR